MFTFTRTLSQQVTAVAFATVVGIGMLHAVAWSFGQQSDGLSLGAHFALHHMQPSGNPRALHWAGNGARDLDAEVVFTGPGAVNAA